MKTFAEAYYSSIVEAHSHRVAEARRTGVCARCDGVAVTGYCSRWCSETDSADLALKLSGPISLPVTVRLV